MFDLTIVFVIWIAGFAIVQGAGRWALRSEPTAHGQIVGRQLLLVLGGLWPLVLIYLIFVLIWEGGWHLVALAKRPFAKGARP